jgi:hypothetical protein
MQRFVMGPYEYMHLLQRLGPCCFFQGIRLYCTWVLPSTTTMYATWARMSACMKAIGLALTLTPGLTEFTGQGLAQSLLSGMSILCQQLCLRGSNFRFLLSAASRLLHQTPPQCQIPYCCPYHPSDPHHHHHLSRPKSLISHCTGALTYVCPRVSSMICRLVKELYTPAPMPLASLLVCKSLRLLWKALRKQGECK